MIDDATCPSDDERVRLFGLLTRTNARLERVVNHELETRCDLPLPSFEVLLQLRRATDGHLTMSEIAAATVHSSGGTTRLIDRLERAGLVERTHCPKDRRAIHVAITDAGNRKLDDALAVHVERLACVVGDRLNADERTQLAGLLEKLSG